MQLVLGVSASRVFPNRKPVDRLFSQVDSLSIIGYCYFSNHEEIKWAGPLADGGEDRRPKMSQSERAFASRTILEVLAPQTIDPMALMSQDDSERAGQ